MKNKVTILIPTYNRYETTLPLSLMSAINQSQKPDRIVLVDDSPIKRFYEYDILKNAGKVSHEVAKKLAEQEYSKFRVIQDKNFESDFEKETRRLKGKKN